MPLADWLGGLDGDQLDLGWEQPIAQQKLWADIETLLVTQDALPSRKRDVLAPHSQRKLSQHCLETTFSWRGKNCNACTRINPLDQGLRVTAWAPWWAAQPVSARATAASGRLPR
jgi:hypothetical protein